MATLQDVLAENRGIGKQVSPTLLVGIGPDGTPIAMAASPSGEMAVSTDAAAKTVKVIARNDYASVNVTTLAWTELVASTSDTITSIVVFDSSGETIEVGVGGAGAEVRAFLIPPGGFEIAHTIASGTRIAVKAVSSDATTGEIILQGVG